MHQEPPGHQNLDVPSSVLLGSPTIHLLWGFVCIGGLLGQGRWNLIANQVPLAGILVWLVTVVMVVVFQRLEVDVGLLLLEMVWVVVVVVSMVMVVVVVLR